MSNNDPRIRYAIYCGARSGSTLLCDLLESTNRLGDPKEYFSIRYMDEFRKTWNAKHYSDYLNKLYWNTKKDNDCIGIKIIDDVGFQPMVADGLGYTDQVTHWIWLRRRNKVLQAISRYKGWKTQHWVEREGIDYDKSKMPKVEYDRHHIQVALDNLQRQEEVQEAYMKGKDYIEFWYEDDLLGQAEQEQTVFAVLNYLGLPLEDLPPLKTNLKMQRNEESLEWERRFRAGE